MRNKIGLMMLCLGLLWVIGCERRTLTPLPTASATLTPQQTAPIPTTLPVSPTAMLLEATKAPLLSTSTLTLTPSTPAATPTPEGRLLSILAEVDFSLPAGNAYQPSQGTLSQKGDRLYVLARSHPKAGSSVIAIVNTATNRLEHIVPLPGYASGPLAEGNGRIYLIYSDDAWQSHLLMLAADSFEPLMDLPVESFYSGACMAFDAARGCLYIAMRHKLDIRAADDLALLQTIHYGYQSPRDPKLILDASAHRLYISLGQEIQAYDATGLSLLWTQKLEGQVTEMALDSSKSRLYLQTEEWRGDTLVTALVSLSKENGKLLSEAKLEQTWRLVAAEAARVYILASSPEGYYIVALDAQGKVAAQYKLGPDYVSDIAHDAIHGRFYVLDTQDHLVRVLDAKALSLLAEIPLGVEIRDIALGGKRLYVNDSTGLVHLLDADDYRVIGQAQAGRGSPLVLDEARNRLYVPVEGGKDEISVLDAASMTVTAVITGGERIALDDIHGRLFVGSEVPVWPTVEGKIRVLDAETLSPLASIPRPGIPSYNPFRDEIYVTDNTVYILDGRTYEEIGELTPDIGAQPLRGCNGCQTARNVYVYPDQGLLLVDVTVLSAGKGAGIDLPPRYFSLRSREPLTYPVVASFTCGGKMELMQPIEGVLYTTASYARYVFYQNLVALQAGTGEVLRWRDGINAGLVVAGTGVIYCERGEEAGDLALDLQDWTPLGYVPHYCIHTLDLSRQRLYATDAARLIVLRDRGGQPMPTPTPEAVVTLPAIQAIYVSPDYADDRTIFISGNGSLFRSQDDGTTWVRLRGGLPSSSYYAVQFRLAFSPAFAQDRTVYAVAFAGDAVGHGVLRSTDSGDTWQMLWRGLDHLRVYDVVLSPNWAEDGTLIAYARYQRVAPQMEGGESVFRSTDRGEHWGLVAMRPSSDTTAPPLPKPEELLPFQRPPIEITSRDYGRSLERTWNGGRSWETVLVAPETQAIVGAVTVPEFPDQGTLYAVCSSALFRSRDHGDSWELTTDPRIVDRKDSRRWQAVALAAEGDGSYRLFLGDGAGNLLSLAPNDLEWQPMPAPSLTPSPSPHATATPLPTPCRVELGPAFQAVAISAQRFVGCPVADERLGYFADQLFEAGRMFWREDQRHIYVLTNDGRWLDFPDTWSEDQPDRDPTLIPPQGREQPIRGFGKVWREMLGGPSSSIGWALQAEVGYQASWQTCEQGFLLTDSQGGIYALHNNGQWQRLGP